MVDLSDKAKEFVAHFGEMGNLWGFNRTVSQTLGLLIISETALCADNISKTLNISRSNVSMAIKELQSWQLIRTTRISGDRKDYFLAVGDFWTMAKSVFKERRKRELDPTLSMLRNQVANAQEQGADIAVTSKMQELYELLDLFSQAADCLDEITPSEMKTALKLGLNFRKLIRFKDEILNVGT